VGSHFVEARLPGLSPPFFLLEVSECFFLPIPPPLVEFSSRRKPHKTFTFFLVFPIPSCLCRPRSFSCSPEVESWYTRLGINEPFSESPRWPMISSHLSQRGLGEAEAGVFALFCPPLFGHALPTLLIPKTPEKTEISNSPSLWPAFFPPSPLKPSSGPGMRQVRL